MANPLSDGMARGHRRAGAVITRLLRLPGPYLKRAAFRDKRDAASFWLKEVDGSRTRLNRSVGLAQHFQLSRKLHASNAGDVLHADYLHDADVMLTADRRFALVLADVASLIGRCARVEYVSRADGMAGVKRAIASGTR